jgi:hypothetical protein
MQKIHDNRELTIALIVVFLKVREELKSRDVWSADELLFLTIFSLI